MSSDPNYEWEQLLDIDDSGLSLTLVLRLCNIHVRKTTTTTTTQVEETSVIISVLRDGEVMSTQEYMKKVVEDVGEDEDFNSGAWVSATEYVNANGGIMCGCLGDIKNFLTNEKLEQVVAIIKSCTPNALGDLTVTIAGAIHHKVINDGGYGKDVTVGSAIILDNVSVFSPKPSMHYLNITMKNVVKVFHKDSVPGNGSGVGGSEMLMEEEEIVKLMEEEEMADLELQVCWNVTHQEMTDEEALNLALEEKERQARAEGGGALGVNKAITHPVIHIFLYPLGAVEAACALEVDAMGALDLVEVEAVGALDLVEVEAVGALDLVEVEAVGALDLVEVGAVGSSSSSSSSLLEI
ncbi:homeobox-leucine zipper protein HDG11 [Tanacetum coccineum]